MNTKYITIILITQILFTAFSAFSQSYVLKGKIEGWPTDKVYLLRQGNYPGLDSVDTQDGSFEFKGDIPGATSAFLITQKKQGLAKFLYVEPGEIQVSGSFENLKDITIIGSKSYEEFEELKKGHETFALQVDKNVKAQMTVLDEDDLQTYHNQMDSIIAADLEFSKNFIKEHPNSMVCIQELRSLKSRVEVATLKELYASLSTELKNTTEAQSLEKEIEQL